MTTTYLPDLSHLSSEPVWLQELPAQPSPEWARERYVELLDAADAAGDDAAAWIELVRRTSELEAFIGSHGSRTGIAYRQETDNEAITEAYQRWNRDMSPILLDSSVELARKIVAAPESARAALAAEFGQQLIDLTESFCRSYAPVNTQLRTELSNLLMEHTAIFGKGTIQWRGETHPFSFARKAALDTDRDERHAAWNSKISYVRENEDALQGIYDKAFEMRRTMATNLDQPSYTALRYQEMKRFDWTPEDAKRVRAAIEKHLTPIASQLQLLQAAALGTDKLHPADEEIQPEPLPEMAVDVDGQLDAATLTFNAMGEEFGAPWRMLVDENLIDLAARPGKGTGGFCSSFPFEKVPFIFCNSVGSPDDVRTLVHEFGHALQGWRSRDIEPLDLQHPTLEACEIHSMTLELLAHPHLGPFYGDNIDVFNLDHLRSTLIHVPYMAAIDEFQHRVYDEGLDAEGRSKAWRDAAERYQPAIDWAADGWYGDNRWLFQLHVFQYPFYYLDYALARIVSWELWLDSLEDRDAAIEKYLALCSAGGTKPFRELVKDAGLSDPFDEATLERTMTRLKPHLKLDD